MIQAASSKVGYKSRRKIRNLDEKITVDKQTKIDKEK